MNSILNHICVNLNMVYGSEGALFIHHNGEQMPGERRSMSREDEGVWNRAQIDKKVLRSISTLSIRYIYIMKKIHIYIYIYKNK